MNATRKTTRSTRRTSATSATRTTSARRTTRTRRTGTAYRKQRGLPSTVGAALGTLVVTSLLNMSWPARIGLLVLVVVIGLAVILWQHRAEIAQAGLDAASDPATPASPDASTPPPTLQP